MVIGSLICDASFSGALHLGGCSGGFTITENDVPKSSEYQGVLPYVRNPSEAEMYAIAMGIKEMSSTLESRGQKLDKLYIYTDSMDAIEQYKRLLKGEAPLAEFDAAIRKMHDYISSVVSPKSLTLEHVKAHVDPSHATPLQSFHNRCDRNAKEARWAAQMHLSTPKVSGSFYGIVLPSTAAASQEHDLYQLGYVYTKLGMHARSVFVGTPPEDKMCHPFVRGILKAASEDGRQLADVWTEQQPSVNGSMQHGCEGLDRTLLRQAWSDSGKNPNWISFSHPSAQNAAIASRLLFGPQPESLLDNRYPTGRIEPASRFVVSVFDRGTRSGSPHAPNEWLEAFSSMTSVPVHMGLRAALDVTPIPEQWRLKDPSGDVKSAIEGVLSQYSHQQPHVILSKLLKPLNDAGIALKAETRTLILNTLNQTSNPSRLLQSISGFVLKQEQGTLVAAVAERPSREQADTHREVSFRYR